MNRRKLLFRYVAPSVLSMVSFFLFSVIDGIFVGRGIGTDALGAVNIVFPVPMIFNACCLLFTIGGGTIMAIRIGRGDTEGANQVFLNSFIMLLLVSVAFSAIAVFLTGPICSLLGAGDTFYQLTTDYLFWYGIFFIPVGLCIGLNVFCRNDNDPILVSVGMVVATSVNIVLDWVFIFPLHMGMKGGAIATGIAQVIQLGIVMIHFIRKKGVLRFRRFRLQLPMIGKMAVRGLPECISQFCDPVSTIVINLMLVKYIGDVGVNAYSVICYVAAFSIAIFAGCAEGLQPLFGNCYGAGNEKDLKYYFRCGMLISVIGAALILVLLWFVDEPLCALYAVDGPTMAMTMDAMFQFSWGFVVQAVNVIISAYLYSTTRTRQAVVINTLRSFIVNVAVILSLPFFFGARAIWYTFGVFEAIVMVVSLILLWRADRNGAIGKALE